MKILVINTGSSSIKFSLFNMVNHTSLAEGIIERIGEATAKIRFKAPQHNVKLEKEEKIPSHKEGMVRMVELLTSGEHPIISGTKDIDGIGHRVVHGGEKFHEPALLDADILEAVRDHVPLAPLHNPANLTGIEEAGQVFAGIPMVGVFDTSFHQSIPDYAFHYALPHSFYEKYKVRRYGFHGTSHAYICRKATEFLGIPAESANFISIHLGNGCSMAAVRNGKSVDTTMGMTPLEGLIMGTRSGDLDPALHFYLAKEANLSMNDLDRIFNKESGLKGIAGSNDMRDVIAKSDQGDPNARLALQMYAYRIKKYIGAYLAVVGRLNAVLFTAGIGENSDIMRRMVMENLEHIGMELDLKKNSAPGSGIRDISTSASPVRILVVPTNEELQIAMETQKVLKTRG